MSSPLEPRKDPGSAAEDQPTKHSEVGTSHPILVGAVIAIGLAASIGVWTAHRSSPLVAFGLVAVVLVSTWLAIIDFREYRLPNRIVGSLALAVTVGALVAAVADDDLDRAWRAIGLGAAMSVVLFFFNLVGGLGMGDVKYGYPMGVSVGWFGWDALVTALLVTTIASGIVAVGALALGKGRHYRLSYGPYMALGLAVGLVLA